MPRETLTGVFRYLDYKEKGIAEGSRNETSFTTMYEKGIFPTPHTLHPTPLFQVSQSWEKPTTKHESMI
ncbi:hypothetical protein, partial [Nostoc sp. CCY 9925]|uniref:hypothetical protein n=1 Tax=Nostoc sp. CCY 9925 TaxID=3103865 RepID=UPI0039C71486